MTNGKVKSLWRARYISLKSQLLDNGQLNKFFLLQTIRFGGSVNSHWLAIPLDRKIKLLKRDDFIKNFQSIHLKRIWFMNCFIDQTEYLIIPWVHCTVPATWNIRTLDIFGKLNPGLPDIQYTQELLVARIPCEGKNCKAGACISIYPSSSSIVTSPPPLPQSSITRPPHYLSSDGEQPALV